MKKGLVLIPAYNEAETIASAVLSIPRKLGGIPFDILVIDDGSTDGTALLVPELSHVHLFRFFDNGGVGKVFHKGVQFSLENGYDYLINFDADLQFRIDDLEKILEPVASGSCDLALGNRFHDGFNIENMAYLKRIGNWGVAKLISLLVGRKFEDVSCGFRCFSKDSLCLLNLFSVFSYTHETILLLCEHNLPVIEVPITVQYFANRHSRVAGNLFKYGCYTLKSLFRILVDFSPHILWLFVAGVFFLPGFLLSLFVAVIVMRTGNVTPYKWAAFLSAFLLGSSWMFFILSLMGKTFLRMRQNQERMLYYLKKILYTS